MHSLLKQLRFIFVKNSPICRFLDYLPLESTVLDVGCGSCRNVGRLKELRPDIKFHGIDISSDVNCEKILKEFKIVNIEYESIPYDDQYFDGIIMSHILEHLTDSTLINSEIHRLLKKGGIIFIATPSLVTLSLPKKSSLEKFGIPANIINFYDDKTHIGKPYDPEDLVKWLPAGFEVLMNGRIRNPFKKITSPIQIARGIVLRDPDYVSSAIWELFGGISYIIAKKSRTERMDG